MTKKARTVSQTIPTDAVIQKIPLVIAKMKMFLTTSMAKRNQTTKPPTTTKR